MSLISLCFIKAGEKKDLIYTIGHITVNEWDSEGTKQTDNLLELCMKKEFCTAGFKNGEDSEDVGNRNEQQNIYRTIPVENWRWNTVRWTNLFTLAGFIEVPTLYCTIPRYLTPFTNYDPLTTLTPCGVWIQVRYIDLCTPNKGNSELTIPETKCWKHLK